MRIIKGTVTSDKMDQTIVVTVQSYKTHPKYLKKYRVSKKYYVHDPSNQYKVGDQVEITETKPVSKLKRWKVMEAKA